LLCREVPAAFHRPELGDRHRMRRALDPVLVLLSRPPSHPATTLAQPVAARRGGSREERLMTRAILFSGAGQPLQLARFPTPEPRGAEVLVRITCCTLCRSDLHTHAGRRTEATPTVLGHEIVGRIEAFGPDAPRTDARGKHVEIDTRITWAVAVGCGRCFYCADNLPQKCERPYKYGHVRARPEQPIGGGLADHVVLVPGTAWLQVPDELPDSVA